MEATAAQYTGQLQNVSVVYNIYRIVLPLVLLITYITNPEAAQLGSLDDTLFIQVCAAYAIFGVILTFVAPIGGGLFSHQHILTGTLILDILAITLLVYTSEGVSSGLGLLLIVTIASGSILIRGRISTFVAAVAALSVMYSELYLALAFEDAPNQFVQAGILGIILFATSLYIQSLSDRFYKAALLADKQAMDIIDLEKLNNEIIQRMRTGVVVVNANSKVLSMNSAAKSTLETILTPDSESPIELLLPEALKEQLSLWKINPKRQPQPIVIPGTSKQVQINFAFLNPESDSDVLIFIEDNRQIVQRVRQMKLASLGRLTASIAHEVRNPLGAISHASQLLKESESVADDDKRMIEIILDHCNRVNMIIEDVLDASRHDDTSSTKVIMKDWLEQFIENYKATRQGEHDIELEINPEEIEVNVITTQLEQVLNNLFENGLRYSEKETGKSTLTVVGGIDDKQHDQQPYLNIIDNGAGISEEEEAQLFEPFHTTEATGTGLGLYISKELCEANQSQLVYERTDDGKSCFSIYFSHPDRSIT
ncbi:MAG: PAS domain-containing sensor histidine kinase [Pseudomonadales bacterium]|nr:PAS domain-containing sensor histidine kinase [Pseudomonadales bacterium]